MSTSASIKAHKRSRQRWWTSGLLSLLCIALYLLPVWTSSLAQRARRWSDGFSHGRLHPALAKHGQATSRQGFSPDWKFWETQAQYAPFLTPRNESEDVLPTGCVVDQVTLLHRHAARFPTLKALLAQHRHLERLFKSPVLGNDTFLALHPEFAFLRKYIGSNAVMGAEEVLEGWVAEELTDLGRRSAYDSGLVSRQRYSPLLARAEPDRPLFTRSSDSERVIETSGYWLMGFREEKFRLLSAEMGRKPRKENGQGGLEKVDLVVRSGAAHNSTLRVRTCRNFDHERLLNASTGPPSYAAYLTLVAPSPMAYLSELLELPVPLTEKSFIPLMTLCAYAASARSLEEVEAIFGNEGADSLRAWYGSVERERGGWCGIFSGLGEKREREVWEQYAYAHDVRKHFERSTGGSYGPSMGIGYVNELLARLQDTVPDDDTTTNRILDENEVTFPRGGKRLFVDFLHDNEMVEILAALNIMTDDDLPVTTSPPGHRNFKQQRLTPFGFVFTVERISCPAEGVPSDLTGTYVRIFINNVRTMVEHEACASSPLAEFGLCRLDRFLEANEFSRSGGYWRRCFADDGHQAEY